MVGITVNALIQPPVYLRDTRAALKDAADEAQQILSTVAQALADGEWDRRTAGGWHERALRLGRLVDQARSAIGWSRESMRGNHRGLGTDGASRPGKGYDDALALLDQIAVHSAVVTRTVLEIALHDDQAARTGPQITGPYADFLRHTGQAIGLYGQTRFAATSTEKTTDRPLREAVDELRRSLDELHRELPGTVWDDQDALATHGALRPQARRLADQFVQY